MNKEFENIFEVYGHKLSYDIRDDKSKKATQWLIHEQDFYQNLQPFERPDLYSVLKDGTVLFIEHFRFDSSKRLKNNGSSQIKNSCEINKDFQQKIKECEDDVVSIPYGINNESNLQTYTKEFNRNFKVHLNKIDDYLQNLSNHNIINNDTNILKAFFIEDVSDWNQVIIDNHFYDVDFLYTSILWDFVEDNEVQKTLDYLFIGVDLGNEHKLYLVDLSTNFNYKKVSTNLDENNFKSRSFIELRGHSLKEDKNG